MAVKTLKLQDAKENWFNYKNEVKKAHWQKHFTHNQIAVLSENPWQLMVALSKLEDDIAIAQAKFLYYSEIIKSGVRPSSGTEHLKQNIFHLINA